MSLRIIINADDLGRNHQVNSAISEALSLQLITSSTIMANSTTWEEIHGIVSKNPQASFGVHLNLTEGKAMTSSDVFHKLDVVDANNCFTKKIREIKRPSRELLDAVYNEWDAQINKVLNFEKIRVSHFDGHHHIHGDYVFRKILMRLCEKYGVYNIRNRYVSPVTGMRYAVNAVFRAMSMIPCAMNFASRMSILGKPFAYMYGVMERSCWQNQVKRVVHTPDYFNSYESICEMLKLGMTYPMDSIIEIMCHPGHPNYAKEYEMMKLHTINKYLSDYTLINYSELK